MLFPKKSLKFFFFCKFQSADLKKADINDTCLFGIISIAALFNL